MDGNVLSRASEFDAFSQSLARGTGGKVRQIWAVGGGKGGVGKSLIASSLAISLARNGHKTIAIDLDLGGANLHTTLGVDLPRRTLSDFLTQPDFPLDQCVVQSGIPNLELISGAQDRLNVTEISSEEKARLVRNVRDLYADYVIFDLGAGTSAHTVDFFLAADLGVITLLPEPTSIENAYRFIKAAYFRKLLLSARLDPIRYLIEAAMNGTGGDDLRTPADLYKEVSKLNPELSVALKREIQDFAPKLVVNQTRTQTDIDIGFSIKSVSKKYFGIDMDYIGYLDYDSAVWQAVRRKRPLVIEFPNSRLVSSIDKIAHYLQKKHGLARSSFF